MPSKLYSLTRLLGLQKPSTCVIVIVLVSKSLSLHLLVIMLALHTNESNLLIKSIARKDEVVGTAARVPSEKI